jgi:hypothetical protein
MDNDVSLIDSMSKFSGIVNSKGQLVGLPLEVQPKSSIESLHLQICCKNSPIGLCANCSGRIGGDDYFCQGSMYGGYTNSSGDVEFSEETINKLKKIYRIKEWYIKQRIYFYYYTKNAGDELACYKDFEATIPADGWNLINDVLSSKTGNSVITYTIYFQDFKTRQISVAMPCGYSNDFSWQGFWETDTLSVGMVLECL